MKNSQTLDPSILLFESVWTQTSSSFNEEIKQELGNLDENLFPILQRFPRTSSQYVSIISTLTGISSVNPRLILQYILNLLVLVFQNHTKKSLPIGLSIVPEFDPHSKTHLLFARYYQIIFLTDLITKIVKKYDVTSEYGTLVKLGFSICSTSNEQSIMYELILPQFASIFNKISKTHVDVIFEAFSQMIINKPEPYLIILKFCALDFQNESTNDFVEIILDYLQHESRKKKLTDEMLSSLSSLILSSKFDDKTIKELFKFSNKLINQQEIEYGRLELMSTLYSKSNKSVSELKEFFESNISALVSSESGYAVAIKCFYILAFGNYINAEELFNVKLHKRDDCFPKLSISSEEEKNAIIDMGSLLIKYFVNSSFIFESQNLLRCILLHYAQIDMKYFMNNIVSYFLESDNDDKFTIFLTCGAAINKEGFVTDDEMLADFNSKLSSRTYEKLEKISKEMLEYRFFYNDFDSSIREAGEYIQETFDKWSISPGYPSSQIMRTVSIQIKENTYIPSAHLVKVLPFILKSTVFKPIIWTEMLVSLAATNNSTISKSTMTILEHNLETHDERVEMCSNIIDMITIKQKPEIVYVCLRLLMHACNFQDPIPIAHGDDWINNMEAIVFVFLASDNPLIRATAFDLLIQINKLQKNDGIFSHFEKCISAIESNAKHNILLLGLPKRLELQQFYAEEITIRQALNSPYMNVWIFFLSELSKIVLHAHYTTILKKISTFLPNLLKTRMGHLHVGLMTMFLSVAIDKEYFDKNIYIYKIFHEFIQYKDDFLDHKELIKIIVEVTSKARDSIYNLFDTFCFTNYTFVPQVISLIKKAVIDEKTYNFRKMDIIYMIIKSVEGISKVRKAISKDVFIILDAAKSYFNNHKRNWKDVNMQTQILFYLQSKKMWLDKVNGPISDISKRSSMFFIGDLIKEFKNDPKIVSYASTTLVSLLQCDPSFGENSIHIQKVRELVKTFVLCHEHNYNVLEPLLKKDFSLFISEYIKNCYNENQGISDIFFNTIYSVIKSDSSEFTFSVNHIPSMFLVGMYKMKTGSSSAEDFLLEYSRICIKKYMKINLEAYNKDVSKIPTIDLIYKHMSIMSESIVERALDTISDSTFSGSVKAIVEVITPFVKNFRLLPNLQSCVPNTFFVSRMSPYEFLCKLYNVTASVKKQEFAHIAVIWEELIKGEDHMEIVPPFIFECKNPEIKRDLFIHLISTCQEQSADLLNLITARLHFSFYAYCEFQNEACFRDEMWVIPVVTKSFNYIAKETLPTIVHFALLFHADHTQTLLKKICKRNGIIYNRRTLSKEALRYLVDDFTDAFGKEDNGSQLINEWAMEAMRWVVGSKSLKIATTSLIILNRINFSISPPQFKEFSNSLCRSVAYFLGLCKDNDSNTNSFINESLKFFDKFFEGNEQFALNYISCFFEFVISVDAYFDKMIPLYMKCKESPVTKKQAEPFLRSAIRPIFNELESDGRALKLFKKLVDEKDCLTDFKYVDAVLIPLEKSKTKIEELIDNASIQEMNYVLGHYSFMAITASTDLMKRIFTVTSMILRKYEEKRSNIQKLLSPKMREDQEDITNLFAAENVRNSGLSKYKYETLNTELNKRALVNLYKSALNIVTQSNEAVEYIIEVAKIDPLIPISNFIFENDFMSAALLVIKSLKNIGTKVSDIVSLTTCESLEAISNLLNKDSMPKIQPFTSNKEMIELISKKLIDEDDETELQINSPRDNIKKLFSNQKESEMAQYRMSPTTDIDISFTHLRIPKHLINTDIDIDIDKPRDSLHVKMDDFLKLGKSKPQLSRTSSPYRL